MGRPMPEVSECSPSLSNGPCGGTGRGDRPCRRGICRGRIAGIIRPMTERGLPHSDGATACPFVAFEDDRDERSDRPDHRHRCYAEVPPAPRAIAHQEAYCLASAFPVCPTFQDWAQREAARTRRASEARAAAAAARGEPPPAPADEETEAGTARDVAAAERRMRDERDAAPQAADEWRGRRPVDEDDDQPLPPPPRRNPPRDWAAPPPWAGGPGGAAGAGLGGAAGAAGGAAAARGVDPDAPRFLADRGEGRGLAGSAADRLAAGEPIVPDAPEPPRGAPVPHARPARVVHSGERPPHAEGDEELAGLVRPRRGERPDNETGRYRTDAPDGDRGDGRRRIVSPRVGDDAPSWEQPRRFEAYPTIKTRSPMPGLPRIGIMVAALALAALVLFVAPGLFGLFGADDGGGTPEVSPSPTVVAESASPVPSVAAEPTPQLYTIKSGDTLSKVAQRFGVTLDDLLAANETTIKDPDRIAVGDKIIIPLPSEPEE